MTALARFRHATPRGHVPPAAAASHSHSYMLCVRPSTAKQTTAQFASLHCAFKQSDSARLACVLLAMSLQLSGTCAVLSRLSNK